LLESDFKRETPATNARSVPLDGDQFPTNFSFTNLYFVANVERRRVFDVSRLEFMFLGRNSLLLRMQKLRQFLTSMWLCSAHPRYGFPTFLAQPSHQRFRLD
jgi:hypothetical protein